MSVIKTTIWNRVRGLANRAPSQHASSLAVLLTTFRRGPANPRSMRETLAAMEILRHDLPEIKLRFVGITALSYRAIGTTNNKLSREKFNELFTTDKPIIANFHGYPETLRTILENYTNVGRIRVHGYNEEGSTTTPFEMLRLNRASRYDIAIDVASVLGRKKLVAKYYDILEENHTAAVKFGEDLIAD